MNDRRRPGGPYRPRVRYMEPFLWSAQVVRYNPAHPEAAHPSLFKWSAILKAQWMAWRMNVTHRRERGSWDG